MWHVFFNSSLFKEIRDFYSQYRSSFCDRNGRLVPGHTGREGAAGTHLEISLKMLLMLKTKSENQRFRSWLLRDCTDRLYRHRADDGRAM